MASKFSRWAVDGETDTAAAAERKREKEEKRRLKEEKARRAAESALAPSTTVNETSLPSSNDEERPYKRRRTSPEKAPAQPESDTETTNILSFPNAGFGPASSLSEYTILNPIEEGSYGHVSRARAKSTGDIVALKKLKMDNTSDGFPVTALREIQTLKACSHPHVVTLREVVLGDSFSE